jgi:hypothetical protein
MFTHNIAIRPKRAAMRIAKHKMCCLKTCVSLEVNTDVKRMLSLGRLRRSGLGIEFTTLSVKRLTKDPGTRHVPVSAIKSTSIGFELKD